MLILEYIKKERYRVDIELNGVYDTYEKLDKALKKEYSEEEGLEYQAGITTQEQFERCIGPWITFNDNKTQIWVEEF